MEPIKVFLEELLFPNPAIIIAIFILSVFDLLTGVFKSRKKGVATASVGFSKTFTKAVTYLTLIVLSFVVTNLSNIVYDLNGQLESLNLGLNTVCLAMVYRELKSILENLIIANKNEDGSYNDTAKLLIPIHNALIFKFNKEFNYNETKDSIIDKMNK